MISRFEGALLGLAVGDALGGPFEGAPGAPVTREDLDRIAQNPVTSDDTAMTISLAESLVSQRSFSPDDVARRFARWAEEDGRGIGRSTYHALMLINRGMPWQEASRRAHDLASGLSAGNGPLMRSAPLALLLFRDPDALLAATMQSSRITHWDERAGLGAAAFNLMLAAILHGETDKEKIILEAPRPITKRSPELQSTLSGLLSRNYDTLSPSGFVFDTLGSAAWCFLAGAAFPDVILKSVSLGGDADTVSAVAGALSGCYYTSSDIPQNWLSAVDEADRLRGLARGLQELSSRNETKRLQS